MLAVAKEWDSTRGRYIFICRESGQWSVASGQWPVASLQMPLEIKKNGEAAKRRENAAHGVSRGSATREG